MSAGDPSFEEALVDLPRFLLALEPYLDQLVLCGGWVPYFYRRLPGLSQPAHGPLLSHDFDVVAPLELQERGGTTLHARLMERDFVTIRGRATEVVFYQHARWGNADLAPVYGEFLTPLIGGETDRSGNARVLHAVQRSVTAQLLRYLDLLLHEPLGIRAREVFGSDLPSDPVVRVPNPATYMLQKAVALDKRRGEKRAKDLAYVFEVAALWTHETQRVREMFELVAAESAEWRRWLRRGRAVLREAFSSEHAEGPVSAERVFAPTVEGHRVTARAAAVVTSGFLASVLDAADGN